MTNSESYEALVRFASGQAAERPPSSPVAPAGPSASPVAVPGRRVPFGTSLPADLHRAFKVRCIARDIRMQDAVEQAVHTWMERHPE
ncbi:hypothetical protein ACFCV8_07490 [Streptomyces sp. NPDC056347]|uniref:hypothetical protein n=1 Tax=Streptomyces sp. NPDC056347 TaxID=3345790 RepID=UPI0035D9F12A